MDTMAWLAIGIFLVTIIAVIVNAVDSAVAALIGVVLGTLGTDYARAVRQRRTQHTDESLGRAALRTVTRNRRHYGGMIVHLGIAIMAIGLTGSGLFRADKAVAMVPGEVVEVGGEHLRFDGVRTIEGPNYIAVRGHFTLLDSHVVVMPERRNYPVQQMPTTESGIHSTPLRDVYVVMSEPVPAEGQMKWGVHVYVNPLVQLIWIGGFVSLLGLAVSLSVRRRDRVAVAAVAAMGAK